MEPLEPWSPNIPHLVFPDLEISSDINSDDFEYEDEAKLVIFPDHYEISLPNIEELPALVSECMEVVTGIVSCFCFCQDGASFSYVQFLFGHKDLSLPAIIDCNSF